MTNPQVSVVIATYNRAHLICQAIESIFKQTINDFEIIVVDDGSSDETAHVLAQFSNRIRVIRQPNRGRSAARNTGVKASQGEIIAFLDSDDLWLPTKLEKQLTKFQDSPEFGVVQTLSSLIDIDGQLLKWPSRARRRLYQRALRHGYTYEAMSRECIMFLSTVAVRRECWVRIGPMDENIPAFEDWDWYLRAARVTKIATVPESLVLYRAHSENTSTAEFLEGRIITCEKQLNYLASNASLAYPRRAQRNFHLHLAVSKYMQGYPSKSGHWMRKAAKIDPTVLIWPAYLRYSLSMFLPEKWINEVRWFGRHFTRRSSGKNASRTHNP